MGRCVVTPCGFRFEAPGTGDRRNGNSARAKAEMCWPINACYASRGLKRSLLQIFRPAAIWGFNDTPRSGFPSSNIQDPAFDAVNLEACESSSFRDGPRVLESQNSIRGAIRTTTHRRESSAHLQIFDARKIRVREVLPSRRAFMITEGAWGEVPK